MSHEALQVIWYLLIGVLIAGYAILDGFDLGVGVLSPFVAKGDRERRLLLNAIGPFWDGNEVWLLTAGGALFAAFPHVYATVFSGFYLALMLVLFALIFRAVSFEFRSKIEDVGWRKVWDGAFFVGSLLPALLTGVALGNILRGVPVDAQMEYAGTFFTLLNPFSLLVGATGLAMFMTHGALWLLIKTEGEVAERARKWANGAWLAWVVLTVLTGIVGAIDVPAAFNNYLQAPLAWVIPALVILFLVLTRVNLTRAHSGRAFLFSALSIASLVGMVGAASFPYLLRARPAAEHGLTIYMASSSKNTLTAMLIIAGIGVPLVIAYTIYVYRVFRGKASVEEGGY
jgi:cytochrome bd ubiquinol oxidase subunit II